MISRTPRPPEAHSRRTTVGESSITNGGLPEGCPGRHGGSFNAAETTGPKPARNFFGPRRSLSVLSSPAFIGLQVNATVTSDSVVKCNPKIQVSSKKIEKLIFWQSPMNKGI
jgi:hypothetical protein